MDAVLQEKRFSFRAEAMVEGNPKFEQAVRRQGKLERRADDIRSEFGRDYTRLLHSLGYRRLKHKTQVFFAPENDHICTRIEHVGHVESVSFTIGDFLGLNTELTRAISIGHDIGHAPFGHLGESILREISEREIGEPFWHEKNGLHFVDDVESLTDSQNHLTNLDLTYAVRDGIISHCGEVNRNGVLPRQEAIDLSRYRTPNQYSPYTWEGCVVKCADKIAYLGRDIEDALKLRLLRPGETLPLLRLALKTFSLNIHAINTTSLMHLFIINLCRCSTPESGLCFSEPVYQMMQAVMAFNYERIYRHPRLLMYRRYAADILETIFQVMMEGYDGLRTRSRLEKLMGTYPDIFAGFIRWIEPRWDLENRQRRTRLKTAYRLADGEIEYKRAVIDYISGMTDNYAKRVYDGICAFG